MKRFLFAFLALLCASFAAAADREVTLGSLLDEMVDRAALAQFPDPAFTCKQASSYDRASKSPEENWFANGDASQFVREEMNGDRKEWVLMDEKGPGAIVRWWITAPHYRVTFRIYIDGKENPEITANIGDLIGGKFLVGPPLSEERARGRDLYLPIPYEKGIKITVDNMWTGDRNTEQGNLYYQINYRTYPDGTKVKSFSMDELNAKKDRIAEIEKNLLESKGLPDAKFHKFDASISPGSSANFRLQDDSAKSQAITAFKVKVDAADLPQALRSTLLRIKFDGKETVVCPLGDFFGGGVGVNPYYNRYMRVEKDGTMHSYWIMPYKKHCDITLKNYGSQQVKIQLEAAVDTKWKSDADTMTFHCNWRQDREIESIGGNGTKDWNYIAMKGKGVYVGDVLSVMNRDPGWWGEGDEKIYVDGETFPSHFGTGTEDYYGYAWCTPHFFEAPFHAQPRAEGPANFGNTTNLRVRLLDQIPFTKDFRFDMEVWHWVQTSIDYSVVTFWYGLDDTTAVDAPSGKLPTEKQLIEEIKAKVLYVNPIPLPKIPGFTFETRPSGGQVQAQEMKQYKDKWKNERQLWWTGGSPGNTVELALEAAADGKVKLETGMTKAADYGIVQFWLDGKKIGEPVDLYNDGVVSTGRVTIGEAEIKKGKHVVKIEIVGKNEKSTNFLFGTDYIEFAAP